MLLLTNLFMKGHQLYYVNKNQNLIKVGWYSISRQRKMWITANRRFKSSLSHFIISLYKQRIQHWRRRSYSIDLWVWFFQLKRKNGRNATSAKVYFDTNTEGIIIRLSFCQVYKVLVAVLLLLLKKASFICSFLKFIPYYYVNNPMGLFPRKFEIFKISKNWPAISPALYLWIQLHYLTGTEAHG